MLQSLHKQNITICLNKNKNMKKEIILKGVQIKNLYEPEGDKKLWSALCIISDEQQKQLEEEIGFTVTKGLNKDTGEEYPEFSFYGKFFDNIPVVDKSLNKIKDGLSKLNNSICDIKIYKYKWSFAKKEGESLGILAFRIVEEGISDLDGFDKDGEDVEELDF